MLYASYENNKSPFESWNNFKTDKCCQIIFRLRINHFVNDKVWPGCPKLGHAILCLQILSMHGVSTILESLLVTSQYIQGLPTLIGNLIFSHRGLQKKNKDNPWPIIWKIKEYQKNHIYWKTFNRNFEKSDFKFWYEVFLNEKKKLCRIFSSSFLLNIHNISARRKKKIYIYIYINVYIFFLIGNPYNDCQRHVANTKIFVANIKDDLKGGLSVSP